MIDSDPAFDDHRWALHLEMIPEGDVRFDRETEASRGDARSPGSLVGRDPSQGRDAARISSVVDGGFFLVYGVLAYRLVVVLETRTALALPILLAIGAGALLHAAINGLLRLLMHQRVGR